MELHDIRKTRGRLAMLRSIKKLSLENYKLLLPVLLAFILRFAWFLYTDNNLDGDSEGRIIHLYYWMEHYNLSSFIDWLPLHFFLMQGLGAILNDYVNGPRLVSVIFGSLLIIPLYKIIKHEIGERLAWISVWFYALAAVYIPISTVTLSEITYTFFLLTALWLLIKFSQETKESTFIAFTFSVCALCWLRFEAWPLAAIFFIILFCHNTSQERLVFYSSLVLIFCVIILWLGYYYTGDWFRGINYSDYQVTESYKLNPGNKLFIKKFPRIIKAFYPTLLVFSLAGTYFLIKKKKMLIYLTCCWPIFLLLLYKTANNTVASFMRYYVPIAILFIPIGFYGLWKILKSHSWKLKLIFFVSAFILEWAAAQSLKNYYIYVLWALPFLFLWSFKTKSLQKVTYLFVAFLIILGFTRKPYAYGGFFHYQKGTEVSALWAQENLPQKHFIILDNSATNDQTQWCRRSGFMPNNSNIIMTWSGLNFDTLLTKAYIEEAIKNYGEIYFLTFKTGYLAMYLNAKTAHFESLGLRIIRVYDDHVVTIYALKQNQSLPSKSSHVVSTP